MKARKYLTAKQLAAVEEYEASGRVAWVSRNRAGTILISLSGGRAMPINDAMARLPDICA